ncbi:GRIK2-like protein, partial [Mya arenaria]
GLFGDDEPENVVNAFKYAVYRVSHELDLPRNVELVYDIQRIPIANRFEASKKVCEQLAQSTMCTFGPVHPDVAAFAGSACSNLHVPHIETRVDSNAIPPSSFSINLHPESQHLAKAVLDVVLKFGWTEMLIIYNNHIGLLKVQSLLRSSNATAGMSVIVRQADQINMRAILKEAKMKHWRHIIVELDIPETALFLKMALQEGMIDSYHHIVINNLDIELLDLEDYRHNFVNLTGFRLLHMAESFTKNILFDMELFQENTLLPILNGTSLPYQCALIFDAVYLLTHALMEMERFQFVTSPNTTCDDINPWTEGRQLYNYLNNIHINGLTGPIRLSRGRRLNFQLDILELGEEGLRRTGSWAPGYGVNITQSRFLAQGVFGNKTLLVSTLLDPPYAMLRTEMVKGKPLKGNDRYEGFCVDLLAEIARIVGFEYTIVPVPDGRFGVLQDGKWDGIVRELIDRKVDLAVAALTINYEREQYIDFTKPFLNLGISILFNMPRREKPGLFSFMNPLAVEIWVYIVAAYFIVSMTIFILARFSPYEWYNPHPCNPETDTVENSFTLSNSFWFCVGTLMQQGSDINPRAVSTRIVGSTWWLFTLIIISSYTANLAAFLTVERMVSPIESAEDLAKQTDISYGTLSGGSTMSFFRDSSIETYQRMWNFMESKDPSVFAKSNQDGIDRVEAGGYAFLMESTSIEYITQRNCNLMQVGGLLDSKGYGIATPMDSPLKDKLSMAILNLQEEGKVQMLYNKWWKGSSSCVRDDKQDTKASALGVDNVGGIFVFLVGGLSLAVIIAFAEFVWNSKTNAREDKQSLCSEMAEELRFAVKCHGSSQKPKHRKRVCVNCKSVKHKPDCPHTVIRAESGNGTVHMRDRRHSRDYLQRTTGDFEMDYIHDKCDFGAGGYLHVEYSDTDS